MKIFKLAENVYFGKALYTTEFNTPIVTFWNDWSTTERMVENPFVHRNLDDDGYHKRLLDFGCTKSAFSFEACALGYEVVGIDLRDFRFKHPYFSFHKENILNYFPSYQFDYIVSISVLEHIGLDAYSKGENETLKEIVDKLILLLKKGGKMIITVPIGNYEIEGFLKAFSYDEITDLFKELKLEKEEFFQCEEYKYWKKVSKEDLDFKKRKVKKPNQTGCFVWLKK